MDAALAATATMTTVLNAVSQAAQTMLILSNILIHAQEFMIVLIDKI